MKQYYGNYLGLCINNDDPERRGRVQIFIPHIMPSLVENWNEAGDDIKILCVGDNLPDSLPSPVVEKLIKMLPWAEVASPILGTSSPGNLITQAVGAVKNFFNQSPVSNPPAPVASGEPGQVIQNQGTEATIRKQPLNDNLVQTLQYGLQGTGLNFRVNSGGQPGIEEGGPRTGSTRHDHGNAADGVFVDATTNRVLDPVANPADQAKIASVLPQLRSAGIQGIGWGVDYMGPSSFHLDVDTPAIWGADGKGANAASWVINAVGGASARPSAASPQSPETTSTSGQAATFNPFQSINPNQIDAGGTLAGSFAQPTVEASSGATVRTASVKEFVANNDGNTSVDVNISSTYQNRTASGIANDSEILGYTIPLDASLKNVAKDSSGNPVAKLFQPALVTFKDGSGREYRVLAVGNDTGGRQVGGNALTRDWGEFGTNTFRTLQKQGLDVSLAKNSLGLPAGTTATYQFLDGEVKNVEQYRALQSQLVASGALDPTQVSTPIDTGAAAVASQSGIPNASSMVNNTDKNGPTAILNINNMAKGVFTYPAAGATLWVFFREGNPMFPVYFAANYGEREWQSAFRQGSDAPGISPQTKKGNSVTSVGTVANFGTGGWKVEDTTDPTNPSNNQKSFMLFGHDGSNMFFNDGYHQIFSKFDRRDQVDGDRFNSTFGTKEELVQSDSNSMVMGDQYIKVGNISPDTINAARNLQNMVNQIMAPLAKSNLASPPQSLTQALNNNKFVNNKFAKDAIKSSQERFKVPAGPFRVPAQVYKEEVNRIFNPAATPTPEQTQKRIDTADINAVPITPPTPPAQ